MYLGQSVDHHTAVGKILNFQTGFASPQFHCVYDELFTSCFGMVTETLFDKDHWESLLQFSSEPRTRIKSLQTLPHASNLRVSSRTSLMFSDILTMTLLLLLLQFLREKGPFCFCKLAMKELLPLRNLITAFGTGFGLDRMVNTVFKCTAHEDNIGCETLANLEPGHTTP
jgi:hypothetical protein